MKKLFLTLSIVACSGIAAIGLCSFTSTASHDTSVAYKVCTHNHVASQGKHCSGSVGCDCSGFSPITNGEEWQKSYCKHCGHKKSCHH